MKHTEIPVCVLVTRRIDVYAAVEELIYWINVHAAITIFSR